MQALIFDIDGVIVDSEKRHYDVLCEVFPDLMQGRTAESLIGLSMPDTLTQIGVRNALDPALHARLDEHYCRHLSSADVRPGIPELILALETNGIRYGFVSTASRPVCLANLALLQAWRQTPLRLLSGDDVIQPKPHPSAYRAMATCLDVPPQHCMVIEDTAIGISAARAAGIHKVFAWPHALSGRQDYAAAWQVITALSPVYTALGLPSSHGHQQDGREGK